MDYYIELARQSVVHYLKTGKILETPANLPTEMLKKRAGVFVSIHKRERGLPRVPPRRDLRGCIGTFLPTRKNVAGEIIYNAISAATEDWRFAPVTLDELDNLTFSVDVLSEPKQVPNDFPLDSKKYALTADGDCFCQTLRESVRRKSKYQSASKREGLDQTKKSLFLSLPSTATIRSCINPLGFF